MPVFTFTLSFIRTFTVGSGITPDLLTKRIQKKTLALAGLRHEAPYRRWGISPRPENKFKMSGFYHARKAGTVKSEQSSGRFDHARRDTAIIGDWCVHVLLHQRMIGINYAQFYQDCRDGTL